MNCPDPKCRKYFDKKQKCIDHINQNHGDQLDQLSMDAAQWLYYSTHGTIMGKCCCGCGRDTEWNYKTGKPYKVSSNPECKKRLYAQAEKNMQKARGAWYDMQSAGYSAMTSDETDEMLSLILSEDEDKKAEDAAWLLENSRYYNPTVSYEWNTSGDNYNFSYSSTKSVIPGEELVLPDKDSINVNNSMSGVLVGWGITPDEVTYEPGATIVAPYTDQTFYAIWESQVVFTDPVTGTENVVTDVAAGDTISVPVLTEPDDSYVFAGWVDKSTGEYIAPDETDFVLEGNGAVFEALWKNAELSDLEARHYDIAAIPVNTQADLSFVISNKGTEDLRNVKIETTGDDGLTVLKGNGTVRIVDGGSSVTVQGVKVVGTVAGDHMLHISAIDRDGDEWSADFTVTIV